MTVVERVEGEPYTYILSALHGTGNFAINTPEHVEGWQTVSSGVEIPPEGGFKISGYVFTYDEDNDCYTVSPAIEQLQRPLYSHEYTFGNFITNGERNQSSNMKAAYITVGGTVQLFKENTTAGKWVTVPNDNNLALMDEPLTAFESGPPSDFQYQGFVFTFSAGDVDGYTVAPALSII